MKIMVLKVKIHVRVQDAKSESVNRCEGVKLKVVQVPPPEPLLQEPPPWLQLQFRRPSVKQHHSPSIYNYNIFLSAADLHDLVKSPPFWSERALPDN